MSISSPGGLGESERARELEREIVEKSIIPTIVSRRLISTVEKPPELQQYMDVPSIGVFQRASNGLKQLQGMRIEHVTLLREIGIKSVYELSVQNPEELYNKILERKRSHENNRDWIPTKGMILRWIRIASQM